MDETELNEKISEKKKKLKKLYESLGVYKWECIPGIIGLICLAIVSIPIICSSGKLKWIKGLLKTFTIGKIIALFPPVIPPSVEFFRRGAQRLEFHENICYNK